MRFKFLFTIIIFCNLKCTDEITLSIGDEQIEIKPSSKTCYNDKKDKTKTSPINQQAKIDIKYNLEEDLAYLSCID